MRANKIEPYTSILQVLDMPGCPVCRYIKNHQSILVQQKTNVKVRHLCNFHMWAVAATQQTVSAASLFQMVLRSHGNPELRLACDFCLALRREEDRRVKELAGHIDGQPMTAWRRSSSSLCAIHGAELERLVSPQISEGIALTMRQYRDRLERELATLCANDAPDATRWGVLGQVAEFLVAQRGLRP